MTKIMTKIMTKPFCRTTAKEKSRRRADNLTRPFFAFTQTNDEFSGNIVANSDLNCCICLKIKKFLMNLLHIPTFANFH